jgi:hypothetical protein
MGLPGYHHAKTRAHFTCKKVSDWREFNFQPEYEKYLKIKFKVFKNLKWKKGSRISIT